MTIGKGGNGGAAGSNNGIAGGDLVSLRFVWERAALVAAPRLFQAMRMAVSAERPGPAT